jgi:hypothetical protein
MDRTTFLILMIVLHIVLVAFAVWVWVQWRRQR